MLTFIPEDMGLTRVIAVLVLELPPTKKDLYGILTIIYRLKGMQKNGIVLEGEADEEEMNIHQEDFSLMEKSEDLFVGKLLDITIAFLKFQPETTFHRGSRRIENLVFDDKLCPLGMVTSHDSLKDLNRQLSAWLSGGDMQPMHTYTLAKFFS